MTATTAKPAPFSTIKRLEGTLLTLPADREYAYIETGRCKPWAEATVRAAKARGYLCDKRAAGVWFIYPQGVEVSTADLSKLRGLIARMVNPGTRAPTPEFDESYQQFGWTMRCSTIGKLRADLGDVMAGPGAPCVKADKLAAALDAYEARRAAAKAL